jgi:host factor-I protein
VEPGNRKLIRPSLTEIKDRGQSRKDGQKKSAPPDQTNAENFYYLKQMQSKTPMTIVLKDGETLKGVIEWYDKTCLKVNRDGEPNLLIFKSNIKYMPEAVEKILGPARCHSGLGAGPLESQIAALRLTSASFTAILRTIAVNLGWERSALSRGSADRNAIHGSRSRWAS